MALPQTLDPSSPLGTDSPSQGDDQLRAIKQYVVDVFGVPNNSAVTSAASTVTNAGLVSFLQAPLTVPSVIQGPASQVLQINTQYSGIQFRAGSTNVAIAHNTGLLMQQARVEFDSGLTGILRTRGSQPLVLGANNTDYWMVNPSGMLVTISDGLLDIGSLSSNRPRNVYIFSNLIVGGNIQAQGLNLAGLGSFMSTDTAQTATGTKIWAAPQVFTAGPIITSATGLIFTAAADARVGSSDAQALSLRTNNTEKLRIQSAGNVGIGSATPTALLHVAGDIYGQSNIFMVGRLVAGTGAKALTTVAGFLDLGQGNVSGETQGSVLMRGSVGWTLIAPGLSGLFLQSRGTGADLAYSAGAGGGGVSQTQDPVAWTGGHTWAGATWLLTSPTVKAGIGFPTGATATLHVGGIGFFATNVIMGGILRLDQNISGRLVLPVGVNKFAA